MLYLAILLLLTIIFPFWLTRLLEKPIREKNKAIDGLEGQYERLAGENTQLRDDNSVLSQKTDETIALYDLTKEICRSLDEDKVFGLFKESAGRYISAKDFYFFKDAAKLPEHSDHEVLPLNVNKNTVGYLAASGIRPQDREKFHILGQQFLLSLGRALLYKKVQELTITDGLTNIYTRRYFLDKVDEEIGRSKKFKLAFSFLMVDIDHFKSFNDNYGHLVGDAILREITKTIKENIRQIDFMGRYGGEEISVILTETGSEEASLIAERIRQAVESRQISAYDESLKVTISIGISLYPAHATERLSLIDKADQALYQAKQSGRNKVIAYS